MANVITYGTFDLFHIGHLRLLQRALSIVRKELLYHGGPIVSAANVSRVGSSVASMNELT